MTYQIILWDIDGTLLNFLASERAAIMKLFEEFSLGTCTEEMLARYSVINRGYWEKLERNELSKKEILVMRFRDFFGEYGLDVSKAEAFNSRYQNALGDTIVFEEGAWEILEEFHEKYRQYIVTNGTKTAQDKKIHLSHIDELVDGVFISEEIGIEKPNSGFFEAVFDAIGQEGWTQSRSDREDFSSDPIRIGRPERKDVLIIGDSLTSDIQGGINACIDTCWYNPAGRPAPKGMPITYTIRSLRELHELLHF